MHFGLVEKKLNNIIGKKLKFTEFDYSLTLSKVPKFTEYISTRVISIEKSEDKTHVIYFSNGDKVQVFHKRQTDKPGLYILDIKDKSCILFCKKCKINDE